MIRKFHLSWWSRCRLFCQDPVPANQSLSLSQGAFIPLLKTDRGDRFESASSLLSVDLQQKFFFLQIAGATVLASMCIRLQALTQDHCWVTEWNKCPLGVGTKLFLDLLERDDQFSSDGAQTPEDELDVDEFFQSHSANVSLNWVYPPHPHNTTWLKSVEVLTPSPCECDIIWK